MRGAAAERAPAFVWLPASIGILLLLAPLLAVLVRIEWTQVPAILTSETALQALRLSLVTAALATVLCVILGVPIAIVLTRMRGFAAVLLRGAVMLPLILPPLVGGMALLLLFGRGGMLGELGLQLQFTTAAVVLAQAFVAMPFLVISVEGALRSADRELEAVAAGLGARPATVLRRVTLPLIAPALYSGIILSLTRALGEFGATAMFAGNAPGTTQTIPLAIYTAFNGAGVGRDTALALALLLICIAFATLLLLHGRPATRELLAKGAQ
ncbi:ABC transporter permease [uncultured Agrococcus sp.]|uniref:ABC transporter permease n=1 Tax=uncultured Agrococcus sp. TaxID=382258 RepID=UPI0025CE4E3D|nr:ABC transporter permease [uncultured Agrococcus sp.]